MDNLRDLIIVQEFTGKYFINESYRPIAKALVDKYEELKHVAVDGILFVENTETKKKNNGKFVFAQIGTISEKWSDMVYQMTGETFVYLLEVYKENTAMMSREQIVALIYHELRHIGKDGKLKNHDIEDWANMVEKLGVDWNSTLGSIPDLLADGVDWESIEGPANLFPAETTLRMVK